MSLPQKCNNKRGRGRVKNNKKEGPWIWIWREKEQRCYAPGQKDMS
jgi:hypothetical protein